MMIDKIGGISPSYGTKKSEPVVKKEGQVRTDNVQISAEATQAADLASTIKSVKASQDPGRQEKLQEVKEKLTNGTYDNMSDEQIGQVADSISNTLFGSA